MTGNKRGFGQVNATGPPPPGLWTCIQWSWCGPHKNWGSKGTKPTLNIWTPNALKVKCVLWAVGGVNGRSGGGGSGGRGNHKVVGVNSDDCML